jgi:hypothetical protein
MRNKKPVFSCDNFLCKCEVHVNFVFLYPFSKRVNLRMLFLGIKDMFIRMSFTRKFRSFIS